MTDYINTPPVQELWTRALRALGDVKNGDYLPLGACKPRSAWNWAASCRTCWPPASATGS